MVLLNPRSCKSEVTSYCLAWNSWRISSYFFSSREKIWISPMSVLRQRLSTALPNEPVPPVISNVLFAKSHMIFTSFYLYISLYLCTSKFSDTLFYRNDNFFWDFISFIEWRSCFGHVFKSHHIIHTRLRAKAYTLFLSVGKIYLLARPVWWFGLI